MTNRRSVVFRILADLLIACVVTSAFFAVSHSGNGAWLIGVVGVLLLAVGATGYLEPSAKMVWVHPLVIMSPELVALPAALLTCHGFECGGIIAFMMAANLFTLVLVGLAFAVFYVRRRIERSGAA